MQPIQFNKENVRTFILLGIALVLLYVIVASSRNYNETELALPITSTPTIPPTPTVPSTVFPTIAPTCYENVNKSITVKTLKIDKSIIKSYDNLWTGDDWETFGRDQINVCLSTQGSMDRLHWIPELVENWQGPISLAVFITSLKEWVGLNLLLNFYRSCNPTFKSWVTVHLAHPYKVSIDFTSNEMDTEVADFLNKFSRLKCEKTKEFTEAVIKTFQPDSKEVEEFMTFYPQNHMRNIARKGCNTEYVLSSDIDIIPRLDSAIMLHDFLLTKEAKVCHKCAYVIPTFEVDSSLIYPRKKEEVIKHWNNGKARPFHFNVFVEGHNATDYQTWSTKNLEEDTIVISHDAATEVMKYYEPFYISSNKIPLFQERFLGYGFTRNSQIKEALSEGWVFKVLTPIFSVHWGLQSMETLINPGNAKEKRRAQTMANRKIFNAFIKELNSKKKIRSELTSSQKIIEETIQKQIKVEEDEIPEDLYSTLSIGL